MYYYSRHLDIFYDVYIIYYFVFTMFFIDTFCLLLLLEIFSLYMSIYMLFFTRFPVFGILPFYSWNLVFFFFFLYTSRIAEYLFYLVALFLLLSQLFTFFYYCNSFLLILFICASSYDAFFHYWNSFLH